MFKWDLGGFSGVIASEKPEKKRYRFHIQITSPYEYGQGWKENDDSLLYERQAKSALAMQERCVMQNDRGNCMEYRDWDNYCYMHPMCWSGYGNAKFIDDMLHALKAMPCVTNINQVKKDYLYPIKPYEYEELLSMNLDNIITFFETEKKDIKKNLSPGGLFAEKYRLPILLDKRYGTNSITSDDIDVRFIDNFYKAYNHMKDAGLINIREVDRMVKSIKDADSRENIEKEEDDYER